MTTGPFPARLRFNRVRFETHMRRKPSFGHILLAATLAVLALWLLLRVRNGLLNVTTGMLFLGTVWGFTLLLAETLVRALGWSADIANKVRLLLITCSILSFGMEGFLRFGLRTHETYMERQGFPTYESIFQPWMPSWFHVREANGEIKQVRAEFTFSRTTNSLGLSEREIPLTTAPNEYRVVALGDSFTEGVDAAYDSTWVRILETKLVAAYPGRSITAINAGVGGSDVFYEYMLLKEQLLAYDPDLVIVAINNTDLHDVMLRGGMDRFQSDGSTSFTETAPKWEWLYGINFTFRHIVRDILQYDDWFMKPEQAAQGRRKARSQIIEVIDSFVDLSQTNDFDLLMVVHPFEWELVRGRYRSEFGKLAVHLKHDRHFAFVDLLDFFLTNEIITSENVPQFFWRLDGHHNGKGYQVIGEALAETIQELQLLNDD